MTNETNTVLNNTDTSETTAGKTSAKKIIGKVFTYIGIGICALLAVILIWLCIDKFILKSPVPSIGKFSMMRVATGSMQGTIDQGDFVIVKKTGDYKTGDIITFFPTGATTPTTHRIINIDDEGKFVTKGDAQSAIDREHISTSQIHGEVVGRIRTAVFMVWFKDMGWIYFLAAILIIGMGLLLLKYDAAMKKQAEQTRELEERLAKADAKAAADAQEAVKQDESVAQDVQMQSEPEPQKEQEVQANEDNGAEEPQTQQTEEAQDTDA
ncbi:MAG: signal peptidase I [Ruminococcaceae bacterium]|nr:signal peptidase I [Oscillospiraceae bacterium]